jgi:EAL domain-containing protein (putative c-di-GMP-specific phosphodiesterase class I)
VTQGRGQRAGGRRSFHKSFRIAIVVYYQPIVSLTTQQIVSFEALIRWEHPQRQLILPNEFIPVAEKSQLIMEIDWWVLRTACSQIKTWQE